MRTAFITGVTGQDGAYLAKHLINHGYKVYGLVRRRTNPELANLAYLSVTDVEFVEGDITDGHSITKLVGSLKPDEVYNLAAQSFVGISWTLPHATTEVNSQGCLNLLNAIHERSPHSRFYQASTSELFGNAVSDHQSETTSFSPRSPYGVSKLYAHWMTIVYRESYGLHASNGILFNHESPLRGRDFVSQKIVRGVVDIAAGRKDSISLGNLESRRDWGFAGDYVEAMHLMLQQGKPDDYVIATGHTHTVRDLLNEAFSYVEITDWDRYIHIDPKFFRPAEVYTLCGDASKARQKLGWTAKTSFKQLVQMMMEKALNEP